MLLEELGGGGMGRVFKAVHRKMNRTVAVKLLPESLVQSPSRSSASSAKCRRSPGCRIRTSSPSTTRATADGTHFYVMDLVDGEDLARLVKEHGPMPVEQAVDCVLQAARGLEYAHAQGVVHRDIKPSNLILDHDGTVKILDLGIARFQPLPEQAGDDLTKTGCVLGTVDYMAPEQAMNTRRADHRADIYSLGCTLYFLLTGQPLFGGETVMERLVAHREHPVPSLRQECPAAPPWLDARFCEDGRQAAGRPLPVGGGAGLRLVAKVFPAAWSPPLAGGRRRSLGGRCRSGDPHVVANRFSPWAAAIVAQKGLDLAIKPAWRTTNDYPLIAGVWSIVDAKAERFPSSSTTAVFSLGRATRKAANR